MRFLIIGLGIYGSNLAIDLTDTGHEVIGVDSNPSLVDAIKDMISTAYIIDATDETALSALPLHNVDLVIVAIGENFGASIRIVALLKKLHVAHIYARAIDRIHESILESFDIDRILTPEQRAASDLVNEMGVNARISSLKIDDETFIMKFKVPERFVGMEYPDMQLEKDFHLKLIAATRGKMSRNILGLSHMSQTLIPEPDTCTVESGDIIVCQGRAADFNLLYEHLRD
ncbi:MAG: TrkA family potassium uptake protein [Paramuribaculum sp.]|nr:TrkA family potassium uptake protein [Paramuribaculum sp.]MDE6323662.1 TrkA family potassium uptake protein [Paramuribaculum sp.]